MKIHLECAWCGTEREVDPERTSFVEVFALRPKTPKLVPVEPGDRTARVHVDGVDCAYARGPDGELLYESDEQVVHDRDVFCGRKCAHEWASYASGSTYVDCGYGKTTRARLVAGGRKIVAETYWNGYQNLEIIVLRRTA